MVHWLGQDEQGSMKVTNKRARLTREEPVYLV